LQSTYKVEYSTKLLTAASSYIYKSIPDLVRILYVQRNTRVFLRMKRGGTTHKPVHKFPGVRTLTCSTTWNVWSLSLPMNTYSLFKVCGAWNLP